MYFANIASQLVACLSVLLAVSYEEQKFLILMKPNSPFFFFMNHGFGVISKTPLLKPRSLRFFPMLLRGDLIICILHWALWSIFELIFVESVRSASRFIFLPVCLLVNIFVPLNINYEDYKETGKQHDIMLSGRRQAQPPLCSRFRCGSHTWITKRESEKAMAPHSSTLTWKITWMEESGGLQSMGSLRVGHDWSDLAAAACVLNTEK